ncbi:hypothetical protein CC80DRAFT_492408 [Byssothecium circinans]|uniref:Uncharacterized protein n=1 Tax=Byssothecium circinans TaxID=147558 RepID=A0A6A5TUL1_9PLEO|nr:hypothetical protein CC80DRAFT_492408 [Byssothecium circinans]
MSHQPYETITQQYMPELPVPLPELAETLDHPVWELPGTVQQHSEFFSAQQQDQPRLSGGVSYPPYQTYPSTQMPKRVPVPPRVQTSASSTVESQTAPQYRSMMDNSTLVATVQPTLTPTSTSSSSTVSPVTPIYEGRSWHYDRQHYHQASGFNSFPSYPVSPPYECHQPKDGINFAMSPLSSQQSSSSQGTDFGASIPIPPMPSTPKVPFRTSDLQHFGFETPSSSFASQYFPDSGIMATAHTSTNYYNPAQPLHTTEHTSLWERRHGAHSEMRRSYDSHESMALFEESPFDEPVPPYYDGNAAPSLVATNHGVQANPVVPHKTTRDKKTKRSFSGDGCLKSHLLPCGRCDAVFKGPYRKGNRNRHFKNTHIVASATDKADRTCRLCDIEYKRPDARRKHEWKKHKIEDCRPEKRRLEKKVKQIFMPARPHSL